MAMARYQAAIEPSWSSRRRPWRAGSRLSRYRWISDARAVAVARKPRASPAPSAPTADTRSITDDRRNRTERPCAKEAEPHAFPPADDHPDRRLRRSQANRRAGQEVPDGSDARAASRLQPDLHRLRADPRIRIDDQAEALDRGMPGGRRRVRGAGRLDLRRRADDLPGHRRAGRQDPGAKEGRHPLHQRHVHPQEAGRVQAQPDVLLQRPPGRNEARTTTSPSSARASSTPRSTASRRPRRAVSSCAPTRRSSRKPTWPRSTSSSPT